MPRGCCVNFDPHTPNKLYPGDIDLGTTFSLKSSFTGADANHTANGLDIMFAPDGTVTSPSTNNPIAFWICGTTTVLSSGTTSVVPAGTPMIEAMHGNPALVVLYPRTGQVIGYSVGMPDQTAAHKANAMKDVL